jgi:ELWxxDGT repeat protein
MRKKLPFHGITACTPVKRFVCVLALGLLFSLMNFNAAAQIQLLKDVNTREDIGHSEYSYPVFTKAGSYFYYISNMELWRSDGTLPGTYRLRAFKSIQNLAVVGTTLYFAADAGTTGLELWKSNGTAAGTVLVKDIYPGSTGSVPSRFAEMGGAIYFTARNATNGQELWKTNGTSAGTLLVKDIISGAGSSNPGYLVKLNSTTLLFVANNGQIGYELWKTNGTAAGTVVVKDINPGTRISSLPQYLTNVNGIVYFGAIDATAGRELWRSDGTNAGTYRVKDIRAGSTGSNVENLINLNGALIFTADDGVHGDELWKSNGTAAGTILVEDLNPGAAGSNNTYGGVDDPPQMGNFKIINGLLYFTAAISTTNYIYRSDGTAAGTFIITEVPWSDFGGSLYPFPLFTYMNGYVYFFNYVYAEWYGDYVFTLFKMPYNGTSPTPVKDFAGNNALAMISHNNNLFMVARLYGDRGYMIVKSDGTAAGTAEFIDNSKGTLGSNPEGMFNHIGYVWFRANTRGYYPGEQEVWRTDGTTQGTIKLGSTDDDFPWVAAGAYVYFVSYEPGSQVWQLWRTGGTTTSTILIRQGTYDPLVPYYATMPVQMVNVSGRLYFATANGELWRSDGTAAGTRMLKQFTRIKNLYGAGGRAIVVAVEGSSTWLYRADATGAYPIEVLRTSAAEQTANAYPSAMLGTVLFFVTQDDTHGNEIWRTDGTAAGTYMVQDMSTSDVQNQGIEYSVFRFILHNNQLFTTAIDNERDTYLWRFNGSQFEKINKEISDYEVVSHNGLIYIWGRDTRDWNGSVLEVTDGTLEGFRLLVEYTPQVNAEQIDYGIVGDIIYFTNQYADNFWRTDGTPCGTFMVNAGTRRTYTMQGLGTSLIFSAETASSGVEPYIYRNINSYVTENCGATLAMRAPAEEQSILTAYPNPYTQEFTIRFNGAENDEADIAVYSATGLPVEMIKGLQANKDHDHIGAAWPKGMYIVKISYGGEVHNYTIIKK